MSAIYFHSEHGTEAVSGRERAYMGNFCHKLLIVAMDADEQYELSNHPSPIRTLLPPEHYLSQIGIDHGNGRAFMQSLRTWLRVGNEKFGTAHRTEPFTAALNTACRLGGDELKLMARLHGQCEVHAYVEGTNRAWLADIIESGRDLGTFREGMGWEAVIGLLRSRDDGAVVTSYSVCEQFPNAHIADWKDDREGEAFWELEPAQRWALAMSGLRASGGGLEMKPDDWQEFYFGNGVDGFTLRDDAYQAADSAKVAK
jgi:hypothetical protein